MKTDLHSCMSYIYCLFFILLRKLKKSLFQILKILRREVLIYEQADTKVQLNSACKGCHSGKLDGQ